MTPDTVDMLIRMAADTIRELSEDLPSYEKGEPDEQDVLAVIRHWGEILYTLKKIKKHYGTSTNRSGD